MFIYKLLTARDSCFDNYKLPSVVLVLPSGAMIVSVKLVGRSQKFQGVIN